MSSIKIKMFNLLNQYKIIPYIAYGLLSALVVIIQSSYKFTESATTNNMIVIIVLIAIFSIIHYLSSWHNKSNMVLIKLADIINRYSKDSAKVETLFEGIKSESELAQGDKVSIITNDLETCDLVENTINQIAVNIAKGVKYEYYIPLHSGSLKESAIKLYKGIMGRAGLDKTKQYLTIYKTPETLRMIFNFALYSSAKDTSGDFYLMFKNLSKDPSDANISSGLLSISLDDTNKENLHDAFSIIKSVSVEFKILQELS